MDRRCASLHRRTGAAARLPRPRGARRTVRGASRRAAGCAAADHPRQVRGRADHGHSADRARADDPGRKDVECGRSEEHTSELQSLMRISYAVFCLKKKNTVKTQKQNIPKQIQKENRKNKQTYSASETKKT